LKRSRLGVNDSVGRNWGVGILWKESDWGVELNSWEME